jgi:hypothetical protein
MQTSVACALGLLFVSLFSQHLANAAWKHGHVQQKRGNISFLTARKVGATLKVEGQ